MRLWVDDQREPWKYGFLAAEWAKNYDEAIDMLRKRNIRFASLDHDLGACADCIAKGIDVGDQKTPETTFVNSCPHVKNGYDIVCWMEENNVWPFQGVVVHSMNPVGRARMQVVIDKHYKGDPWRTGGV